MTLNFNTYEELSDFCYPYEKNLGSRDWTDDEKYLLLEQIAKIYRENLDEIADKLGSKYTLMVHVTMNPTFLGRCWYDERIIELNPILICCHPLLLTKTIIHELTHYQCISHSSQFILSTFSYSAHYKISKSIFIKGDFLIIQLFLVIIFNTN